MNQNIETVRRFIDAWSRLDANELSEFFTRDGTYYNMPIQPVVGRENIKAFIDGFIATWTETHWEVKRIAGDGDLVFCERVDRTKTTNGNVDLPCLGVFEMHDGQIHVWRDYFDMATFTKAMG